MIEKVYSFEYKERERENWRGERGIEREIPGTGLEECIIEYWRVMKKSKLFRKKKIEA